ncbi:serine hydrolase [soil metagenome]
MRRSGTLTLLALLSVPASGQEAIPPVEAYACVAEALTRLIEHEVEQKGLPALSIALVDDQEIVWAQGFGMADPDKEVPATAETVYRVGSVSKLFTAIAALQLVELGKLDLDAPVNRYLADFRPEDPFENAAPITLRQLMSHRSGLVRESPIGHYFDPTAPTLAATVKSLNSTKLVNPPEARTKYSNAGVALVGYVVEQVQGKPFANVVEQEILKPLGMTRSGFERTMSREAQMARAEMWTYEGRTFEAPNFPIGTAPAGNLDSTVIDLGRFLIALFNGGKGAGGEILKAETIEQMFEPQFEENGPFGLGFALSNWKGLQRVGHGGAVYGFSTELSALPVEKLGVVVVASKDVANAVTRRIADDALLRLLAVRAGVEVPEFPNTEPIDPDLARSARGRYEGQGTAADLIEREGRLYLEPDEGGYRVEVRKLGDRLLVDDALSFGSTIELGGDELVYQGRTLRKVAPEVPEPAPDRWAGLIGEYGWDHNILYILEKDGQLHALIEWFFLYPLEGKGADTFAFPEEFGLYHGEEIIFKRDTEGRASQALAASVVFDRRPIRGEDGSTFQVDPLRPVEQLRSEALAASPPEERREFRESNLVDLAKLDPTIKLDIRYAGTNNFLGTPFYSSARAFLQRPAAEALLRAHESLKAEGFGLLIHDAYRPWHVTKMFWDATPEESRDFVADPSRGSRHNRGCAVDLTLYDLQTGEPVPMVAGYDEFSSRAHAHYPGGTARQRWHRDRLRRAMEEQGFAVYELEWWHFDFQDWQEYAIGNEPFEELEAARAAGPGAGRID